MKDFVDLFVHAAPAQTVQELLREARKDLCWRVGKKDKRLFTACRGNIIYTLGHLTVENSGWELYFLEKDDRQAPEPIGSPYLIYPKNGKPVAYGDARIKIRYDEVEEFLRTPRLADVLPFPRQ